MFNIIWILNYENINHSLFIKWDKQILVLSFFFKMAFSSSACKDVQWYVQDIFDGSFRYNDSEVILIFFFLVFRPYIILF